MIVHGRAVRKGEQKGIMSKRTEVTCTDCFFRRAGLCALPGDTPCPTFRAVGIGSLEPPHQPRLVLRAPALAATA